MRSIPKVHRTEDCSNNWRSNQQNNHQIAPLGTSTALSNAITGGQGSEMMKPAPIHDKDVPAETYEHSQDFGISAHADKPLTSDSTDLVNNPFWGDH
jgi:hypothetical protein